MDKKVEILSKYVPLPAAPLLAKWIDFYHCDFKISKSRSSKFGDYRPPQRGEGHKISINYNLNPYAFLVTTVHEFAHLVTWKEFQQQAKPHGTEWKLNFKRMMQPFFELEVFPNEVKIAIQNYLTNPAASSCSDINLFKALKAFDVKPAGSSTVEQIKENQIFCLKNGRTFKKLSKIRKRYRCIEIKSGLVYLFSPISEVFLVNTEKET
ncbi:SprT-like domain-containing protein [Pedobacter arcticus]|uniref:SprT-like domain-containing protein n=1 Tax=Pedobacter arcticus TaxID=752140 RepID=UPI000312F7B9|nr:SprT-like domain-containing protein [Pedobacter arcticus]